MLNGIQLYSTMEQNQQTSCPDASSRHPSNVLHCEDTMAKQPSNPTRCINLNNSGFYFCRGCATQELRDKATQDDTYQELHSTVLNGFPAHHHHRMSTAKRYWAVKEHLSVDDGLIAHSCSPEPCLNISRFYESHQVIFRMNQQTRWTVC